MNIDEEAEKLFTALEESTAKLLSGVREDKEVVISNRRKFISNLYETPLANVIHEGVIKCIKIEGTLTYE
jgi:hypothetical protein